MTALLQTLQSLIEQRLSAVAKDIFMDVERIITELEEFKRQHTLLHMHPADLPLLSVCKEEEPEPPLEEPEPPLEEPEPPLEEAEPPQVKREDQEELLLRPEEADSLTLTLSHWSEHPDTLSVSVNTKTLSHDDVHCSKSPIEMLEEDLEGIMTPIQCRKLLRTSHSDSMLEASDVIRTRVLSALPYLPVEVLGSVVERLMKRGAETEEDLHYVVEEDVKGLMKLIDCRKLVNAWKPLISSIITKPVPNPNCNRKPWEPEPMSAPPRQMSSCVPLEQSASVSTSSPTSSPPASRTYWPENFKVNWDRLPPSLLTALRNGKRPSPGDRRHMVRVIVDDMQRIAVNPRRAECLVVTRNIVDQYPQSFDDNSLLAQIKTRVDFVNRKNPLARHRKRKNPDEERKSLENKRRMLTELFSWGMGTESADVSKMMETTFSLQRQMINADPAPRLSDVKQQWPYLFFPTRMCAHFERLTDVPILLEIGSFLEERGSVMEFFKRNPTNDAVKAVLHRTEGSATAANTLQLLMAHFKEPLDALVIQTDESATPAFVQLTVPLVDSPRLIVAGPMTESNQRWMMSIQKQVLCEGTCFLVGLAVLFSSYYNFNLQYQHDAACTLEFIQRCCIDWPERVINTSQEMMVQNETSVNPHVSALLEKLSNSDLRVT